VWHYLRDRTFSHAGPRFRDVTRGLLQRHSCWGIQVHYRQAPASYECHRSRHQRHSEVRPWTHQFTARQAALPGRFSAGAVQAVFHGPSMSAEQGTTVHDGLLRPHLSHCSSAAPAVRRQSSAVRTATPAPAFDVRSSGLFCGWPGGLELVARLFSDTTRSFDSFRSDLKTFLFSLY